jgi:hypothetical protein
MVSLYNFLSDDFPSYRRIQKNCNPDMKCHSIFATLKPWNHRFKLKGTGQGPSNGGWMEIESALPFLLLQCSLT